VRKRLCNKGLDSQLDPIECADEGCGGKEVSVEFVIARGDPLPVFDAAKVVFDFVPSSVKASGVRSMRFAPSFIPHAFN
jgi:hypothetical protein